MIEGLIPIVPGMSLLPGQNGGRFPFSHSVLLDDDGGSILIDAGCGLDTLRSLRQGCPPSLVIASHCHVDHVGGCYLFAGTPLAAPAQSAATFGRLDLLAERLVEPGPLVPEWLAYVRQATGMQDVAPTDLYDHGRVFRAGRLSLVAVHTPGHTVDHMCLWEPDHRVLLSFDIDLTRFGPWYGHRESDIEVFKQSVRRVMDLKPRIIVSSHKGVVTTGIQAGLQRFLDVFDERDRRIVALLDRPRSLAELTEAAPIYGGFPYAGRVLRYWEQQMIGKHLQELESQGQVERVGEQFVRRSDPRRPLTSRCRRSVVVATTGLQFE